MDSTDLSEGKSKKGNDPYEIPNRELVLYVLFLLGGDTRRVHTEDIAVKCHELFPGSFSWVGYPQYPDKEIVRSALTDARKLKYGAHVEGRAGRGGGLTAKTHRKPAPDGWQLTSAGLAWLRENGGRLERFAGSGQVKEHRQKVLKQLKRTKDHRLFREYIDSPERFHPMIGDIADLLRCRVDAEEEIWSDRFDKLQRQAESVQQADVATFVDLCRQAYKKQR